MERIIKAAVDRGASNLHIAATSASPGTGMEGVMQGAGGFDFLTR